MKFSLIVCTYMRPEPLLKLLQSVQKQTLYPDEILIIDGSLNHETEEIFAQQRFDKLRYYYVNQNNRGLTKQRNLGLANVSKESEVVCFVDDDTILEKNYFVEIIKTFSADQKITGVGGIAINENKWKKTEPYKTYNWKRFYVFEGYVYPEGLRNVFRNYLHLQSDLQPGRMPEFSHGRTCSFPPNGKTYEVDLLIGMSFCFRKSVYERLNFSTYFEGYGLYEDADYSIRALQYGKNVINTNAQLSHFHNASGRPNQYQYGKMVVRNGWYVWRVKYPKPAAIAIVKWHLITLLLALIRFGNTFTTSKRQEAFTEFVGRITGWVSLFLNIPKEHKKSS